MTPGNAEMPTDSASSLSPAAVEVSSSAPAEENTGGKIDLIDEGFFDDVRFAMMAHAAADDAVGGTSLAMGGTCGTTDPRRTPAAPQHAVNALDAVTIAQVAIGLAGAVHHTAEFARTGASASADRAVLDGAFGLAAAAAAAALDPE